MGKTEAPGGNWGLTRSHLAIQGQTALEPSPHALSLHCAVGRVLEGHTLPRTTVGNHTQQRPQEQES